jgi:hypothetical protein
VHDHESQELTLLSDILGRVALRTQTASTST